MEKRIFRDKVFDLEDENVIEIQDAIIGEIVMTPRGYLCLVIDKHSKGVKVFVYDHVVTTTLPKAQKVKRISYDILLSISNFVKDVKNTSIKKLDIVETVEQDPKTKKTRKRTSSKKTQNKKKGGKNEIRNNSTKQKKSRNRSRKTSRRK